MFAAKRLAVVIGLVLTIALCSTCAALAQTGGGNPSGGTGCCSTGGDSEGVTFTRGASIDVILRSWVLTFIARHQTATSVLRRTAVR